MLKKVTIGLSIIFAVCFFGALVCLPFGVWGTIEKADTILNNAAVSQETIQIKPEVDSVYIDNIDYHYGYILFRQSPTGYAYVEQYGEYPIRQERVDVSYEGNQANIIISSMFGKYRLNRDIISQAIAKGMGNYPDIIIYLPKDININKDTDEYTIRNLSHLEYENKQYVEDLYGF